MQRLFSGLVALGVLLGAIAACADDDDDAPSPVAATANVQQQQPSPTADALEPTARSTQSPATLQSTPPLATARSTVDATPNPYTPEQSALAEVLLRPGELPGGWRAAASGCRDGRPKTWVVRRASHLPARVSKVAEVETEYQSEDNRTFVVQNLTEYPESVAELALQHIRESVTCNEFTDSAGLIVEVNEADAPVVGDEAFVVYVSFQAADAGRLQGDFVYIRVGGLLSSISYLTFGDYDRSQIAQVAEVVADRMAATGGPCASRRRSRRYSTDFSPRRTSTATGTSSTRQGFPTLLTGDRCATLIRSRTSMRCSVGYPS